MRTHCFKSVNKETPSSYPIHSFFGPSIFFPEFFFSLRACSVHPFRRSLSLYLMFLLMPLTLLILTIGSVVTQEQVNPHYTALLNDSMWFYEAQRSGKLPADNRVSWRSDSGLQDGKDNNVDLSGGYYDAGDYLKFTLPLAHSLTLLAWGAIEWFDGYEKAKQTQYLDNTIRWGTDWLMKAHPQPNVLYVQVGDGDVDNNYWGPDTHIPTPRPSYMVNQSVPGTDAAALTAAAFASASHLYRHYLNDSKYADRLQSHAESVYNFADTAKPWAAYTNSIPAIADYYNTNDYKNQLVYGALWLYRATGNTTYRDKASDYFDRFQLDKSSPTVMDWSDQTGAVYVLGSQADSGNSKYKNAAQKYIDTMIHPSKGSPCDFTKGGLLWCDGASDANSLVPAQDIALLALIYSRVDSSKRDDYTSFATNQVNYLLGQNMMLTPYVCGVHMNSPHNPHHAGASGGNDINHINSVPPEEKYILYGAIVGGPSKDDHFYDERNDYDQTEVALDYNAPFQGLIAYQLSTGANDPPYVSITDPRPQVKRPTHLEKWLIAVIVICVLFLVAGCLYGCWLKRRAISARFGRKQVV
ncbi:Six-hairpin glycosidase-like protein [Radiomyces spectabilis]|uniref:Six-hairpin glycosidase-like protein n=1 Tax=Radiomyces spectabilis TaxID=64574 RepID=UPI002220B060|nr:Six-hairpin glycosidase-like protein [Radiomyces spectabilis]KAI8393647.1 Six-hairpin glycosidase-like protein [Radiomyces spectabilis]